MSGDIVVSDVIADVERIQNFDANSLIRRDKLGDLAFEEAVKPAKRLISIFEKLPTDAIQEFPYSQLSLIQQQAKSTYALFEQISNFSLNVPDPGATRSQFIEALQNAHQSTFNQLFPLISYSVARTVDFGSLEARGRAAIQAINDDKEKVLSSIRETSDQATTLLQNVRDAAAEQGVTQMAKYFGDEAIVHGTAAKRWLFASIASATVVIFYSGSTLFLFKWFIPESALESAQIITSKVLIFGVLAYGLFQCVRNYSAHRHNEVTNKHRKNALMTYTTLAEAGNSPELRDAVLQHAAAAIYAPNDSGYLKGEERGYGAQGLLALLPRAASSQANSSG